MPELAAFAVRQNVHAVRLTWAACKASKEPTRAGTEAEEVCASNEVLSALAPEPIQLFDVQQPPELTVTHSGLMQEHSSSLSIERFPSQRAVQENRIGHAQNLVGRALGLLLTEGDDGARTGAAPAVPRRLCPASCAAPAVSRQQSSTGVCRAGCARLRCASCAAPAVPHRLYCFGTAAPMVAAPQCRAGSARPAVPRWWCRASWVGLCGVAAAAAACTHVVCHSAASNVPLGPIIPAIENAITNVVDF